MAGYNGYSKSNNAREAEADGRYPASTLAKRIRQYFHGVTASDLRAVLKSREYHHTSKRYNTTDYYDMRDFGASDTRRALRYHIRMRPVLAREKAALEAAHQREMAEWRAAIIDEYGSLEAYWKTKGII